MRYEVSFTFVGHDAPTHISTWPDYDSAREFCDDAMRVPPSKYVVLPGCYCICRGGEITTYGIHGVESRVTA